jgi:hypothetical protein
MITIRFRSKALKDKAMACLAGKARFKDSMPGALSVSDEAFDLLTERKIPFIHSFTETTPADKRAALMGHPVIVVTAG